MDRPDWEARRPSSARPWHGECSDSGAAAESPRLKHASMGGREMKHNTRAPFVATLGLILLSTAFTSAAEAATRGRNHIHTLMINSGAQPSARGKINFV